MPRPGALALLAAFLVSLSCLTACNAARPAPAQQPGTSTAQKKTAVVIDQDGGVEDLVAVMLLLLDPKTDLLMVSYLEADSIKDVAVNTTLKLMHFLNVTHVPLAVSTLKTQNAFPLMYRAGPLAADVLPALNPPDLNLPALRDKLVSKQAGQDALTELLLKQKEPVTVVATGPLTNIAYALKKDAAVADKIARIWWMGGTLRHPGNIFNQSNSDGRAEWNVFADPQAAGVVWDSKVPVTLVPLDATNKVPITTDLMYRFGQHHKSRLANLVGSMYAPTVTWVYLSPHDPYFAWDSLDAACFLQPSICKMQQEVVQIVLEGPSQGFMRVKGQNNSSSSNGGKAAALSQPKQVIAAVDADAKKFDDFVFSAFAN